VSDDLATTLSRIADKLGDLGNGNAATQMGAIGGGAAARAWRSPVTPRERA
jgi:hypothetical protein